MERCFLRLMMVAGTASLFISGCTDWSKPGNWPQKNKFKGQRVQLYERYVTGDYGAEDVQRGQEPAKRKTYYAYMKNGKQVLHGRATWWFATDKPKAETTYVHGVIQARKSWYASGIVREKVTITPAGEEILFFDPKGKQFASQTWDKTSDTRVSRLHGKVTPNERFSQEVLRICYSQTRITPY